MGDELQRDVFLVILHIFLQKTICRHSISSYLCFPLLKKRKFFKNQIAKREGVNKLFHRKIGEEIECSYLCDPLFKKAHSSSN